jgi:ElaB/YqjD/DUF883 family membrane-anchored ribosome-binding protein
MAYESFDKSTANETIDRARDAMDNVSQTLKNGYDAAQNYVQSNEIASELREFVKRDPWIAIAAAFAVGYVAAKIAKRIA